MTRYRRLSLHEVRALEISPWRTVFIPDIQLLDRAATAEDVARGAAVFHLAEEGKRADMKLPAVATLTREPNSVDETLAPVLVVQAEVDAQGKIVYGVLQRGGARRLTSDRLSNIKPLPQSP